MTAPTTAEDWGRLAVSLPGWPCHSVAQRRGMVGWLYGESADVKRNNGQPWPIDGLRAMFIVEKGVTTLYQVVESGGYPQHRMKNGRHEFIPDPDHPATEGWLLAMIGPERATIGLWRDRITVGPHLVMDTSALGRACIRVAAALGRWPEGHSET